MEQRSDDWFSVRLGKVTASKIADVMAKTKSGYGASRANYMMQLLCERLTGAREESYTNAAMQRGTDLEPVARSNYELLYEPVTEVGFILHPTIAMSGASPDGVVGDGLLEIKCPNTATHVEFIRTGVIDKKYILQMSFQMMCADKVWCDFVSFDDRLPPELQMVVIRVDRDKSLCDEIETEVKLFLSELGELEAEMLNKMGEAK